MDPQFDRYLLIFMVQNRWKSFDAENCDMMSACVEALNNWDFPKGWTEAAEPVPWSAYLVSLGRPSILGYHTCVNFNANDNVKHRKVIM